MTPGSIEHRLRIGKSLVAGEIDEATARRRLAGCIGLGGRDDMALLAVMLMEERWLAETLPLDVGQAFHDAAQKLEDAVAELRLALRAEAQMGERAA